MALVMHVGKPNKNALKVLIAAEYVGVEVKCPENFEMGVSNKTSEFLKMNPLGKVPVLETPDGVIFESNAIARYVARLKTDTCSLFGSSPIEYGQIEQWIDFASLEIDLNLLAWLRLRFGLDNYVAAVEEASIAALKRALSALNIYLASHNFLVGDDVTLADIIMICNLYSGFRFMMTKTFTSEFPHVERYFWTMVNQPNFSKIIGDLKQTEVVPPIPSKTNPYAKPKDEPKLVENEDETPKPKAKNRLDLLPPSKMNLDDMEHYAWTKVDLSDEIQKERVNQMIEDHEPFEGKALLDAKCFK
ncbi:hypothetical protein L1987_27283 [Smallanthus sonchifolius]|uniref:Uncharacterized protein n=1 Tax=Smallanthus sonchifolius TaxID=185202 RepID=A0ACB9IDL3_9ASTR|nr:hypothetical protein L1987_27283 [Smallanthus sonchifolius]